MLKKITIALSLALVVGTASSALAMTHRSKAAVTTRTHASVVAPIRGGFTAAEKAWFDRASRQSNL